MSQDAEASGWLDVSGAAGPADAPLDDLDAAAVARLGGPQPGPAVAATHASDDLPAPPPFSPDGVDDPSGEYGAPEISGEFAVSEVTGEPAPGGTEAPAPEPPAALEVALKVPTPEGDTVALAVDPQAAPAEVAAVVEGVLAGEPVAPDPGAEAGSAAGADAAAGAGAPAATTPEAAPDDASADAASATPEAGPGDAGAQAGVEPTGASPAVEVAGEGAGADPGADRSSSTGDPAEAVPTGGSDAGTLGAHPAAVGEGGEADEAATSTSGPVGLGGGEADEAAASVSGSAEASAQAHGRAQPSEEGAVGAGAASEASPQAEDEGALFIPTLTRTVDEEAPQDESPDGAAFEGDAAQLASAPAAAEEDLDEADEIEELEDLQEVEEAEEVDDALESPVAASPARPPSPPPERRRRKHWAEGVFAEHFHALERDEAELSAERDAEFIADLLGLDEGAHVLDVGAGTGTLTRALARRGLHVTGLDNSLSQVLRANEALATATVPTTEDGDPTVSFMHGDMREIPTDEIFDGVACVGTTFGYFEEDQNRQVLDQLRDRLRPGGRLVLQVFNRDHLVSRLPVRSWWQGKGCLVLDEAEMNFFANRLRVHRTVVFEDGRQYEHYMFIRAYTLHDVGKLMTGAGLRVLEVSGSRDTRGRFYGATSPDIWVLAERPEADDSE